MAFNKKFGTNYEAVDYDIGCCIWQQTQGSDTWVVLLLTQWMKTTGQSEMCLKDLLTSIIPTIMGGCWWNASKV